MKSEDFLKFASTNNLNQIVHFHNHLKSLISEVVSEIDKLIINEEDVYERKNLRYIQEIQKRTSHLEVVFL